MSIETRSAEPGDARDVVHVLRESRFRFIPYAPPAHSESDMLEWVKNQLIPSGGVTVAVVEESIVGVLAVEREGNVSWVNQLYVAPSHCGQGIGTQLLQQAVSMLQRPIRLYTFQANSRARHFYERFGFVPIEFSDGSTNEEQCPDVLYELI